MTKKDYIVIADAFAVAKDDNFDCTEEMQGIGAAMHAVMIALQHDNPRFRPETFRARVESSLRERLARRSCKTCQSLYDWEGHCDCDRKVAVSAGA